MSKLIYKNILFLEMENSIIFLLLLFSLVVSNFLYFFFILVIWMDSMMDNVLELVSDE